MKRLFFALFCFVFVLIFSKKLCAQNDIQISHFMFTEQSYNPALTGKSADFDATLLARQQWVGFKYAPSTQLFNFGANLGKPGGIGVALINDKLGFEKSINARLMYAYHYTFFEKYSLSVGLAAGLINRTFDGTQFVYENRLVRDPYGLYSTKNELHPTIDAGLAFGSNKFFVGLSATHIAQGTTNSTLYDVSRHYYFYGNYKFTLHEKIMLVPSLFIRSNKLITQIEGNANVYFSELFWAGISYRVNEAVIGLVGINIGKMLRIGYSYDFNTGSVRDKGNSTGSHEIYLSVRISKPPKTAYYYKSPRLFN